MKTHREIGRKFLRLVRMSNFKIRVIWRLLRSYHSNNNYIPPLTVEDIILIAHKIILTIEDDIISDMLDEDNTESGGKFIIIEKLIGINAMNELKMTY